MRLEDSPQEVVDDTYDTKRQSTLVVGATQSQPKGVPQSKLGAPHLLFYPILSWPGRYPCLVMGIPS